MSAALSARSVPHGQYQAHREVGVRYRLHYRLLLRRSLGRYGRYSLRCTAQALRQYLGSAHATRFSSER
eukprot:2187866-Rhodomonas_salina.5